MKNTACCWRVTPGAGGRAGTMAKS
jgi:hypothetical protein